MTTIHWVIGSSAPIEMQLEQDAGAPATLTGVELHVSAGGACHKLPATQVATGWEVTPTGLPAGVYRAQVWWAAGGGLTTLDGAYFTLDIQEVC